MVAGSSVQKLPGACSYSLATSIQWISYCFRALDLLNLRPTTDSFSYSSNGRAVDHLAGQGLAAVIQCRQPSLPGALDGPDRHAESTAAASCVRSETRGLAGFVAQSTGLAA